MRRAADRKKLRQPLQHAEDERLENGHGAWDREVSTATVGDGSASVYS
jgi:hypothetical protein